MIGAVPYISGPRQAANSTKQPSIQAKRMGAVTIATAAILVSRYSSSGAQCVLSNSAKGLELWRPWFWQGQS